MTLRRDAGIWVDVSVADGPAGLPRDEDAFDACGGVVGLPCARRAEVRACEALAEQQMVELNHRMANMLQEILVGIQRQRRLQDVMAARDELDRLEMRIQAAAALQWRLLEPGRHARVDLGGLIAGLASDIEGVTGLVCHVDAEPVSLPGNVATHLATSVNELAWNAYKHGYRGAAGGALRVVCRRDGDGRLRVSVADSGQGLRPGFDARTSTGLGLSIVRASVRRFDGQFGVESDRETRFTLLLPFERLLQAML